MLMMLEITLSVTDQDELDELYPRIKALLPKAQVKVAQPAASVPATQAAPAPQPTPEAVPAPHVPLEAVRAKLAELSRQGKTEAVRGLLSQFKATKLSDVPADQYVAVMAAAELL